MNKPPTGPSGPAVPPATSGEVARPHALIQHRAALANELQLADAEFLKRHDGAIALGWVQLAAKAGVPLPPNIGAWLAAAIQEALNGEGSLDAALGLRGTGKANVLRARAVTSRLQNALARMFVLHSLGATIEQAACLVATLGAYKYSTLFARYSRSGMGAKAQEGRDEMWSLWDADHLRAMLAEYPDPPDDFGEVLHAKAAVMGLYWKRRT